MQFFRHRRRVVDPETPGPVASRAVDPREAYAEGVRHGRLQERARRRGHPVLGLLVGLIAVVGAAMLALAAREGSFGRGGQVVDQNLSAAAGQAQNAGADALAKTGQAIQNTGASIEQKAQGGAAGR